MVCTNLLTSYKVAIFNNTSDSLQIHFVIFHKIIFSEDPYYRR